MVFGFILSLSVLSFLLRLQLVFWVIDGSHHPVLPPLYKQHIATCAGLEEPNFIVIPFYKMNDDDRTKRLLMEKHFIEKFKPSLNATL